MNNNSASPVAVVIVLAMLLLIFSLIISEDVNNTSSMINSTTPSEITKIEKEVEEINKETNLTVKIEKKKDAQIMYENVIKNAVDNKYIEILTVTKKAIEDGKSEVSVRVPKYVGYSLATKLKKSGFDTKVHEDSLKRNEYLITIDIIKLSEKYD